MRWRRQNLRGLSRHEPGLALGLLSQSPEPDPNLEVLRGPTGAWTARRQDPTGRRFFLHSRMDPLDQSRRVLEACLPAAFRLGCAPAGSVCVLLGLGLGWPALAAAALLPADLGLWLAEPGPELFSRGMDHLNLEALWGRRRLRLFFGPPEAAPLERLGYGAWSVAVSDTVLDGDPGARTWALAWLKRLGELRPAPVPEREGLPAWLALGASTRMRGELP